MSAAAALRPSRVELQAAVASAALFSVAFPPFPLIGPVFLALVPLAIVVAKDADAGTSARTAVRLGFWFGAFAYGVSVSWIVTALAIYTKLAILGWFAAVLVMAMTTGVTVGALLRVRRASGWPMAIVLPVVWVAGEFVLEHSGALAFPWLPLGLATAPTPLLAQIADVSGVHGASFWIAAMNGLVADMWLVRGERRAFARRAAVIVGLTLAVAGYGAWRLHSIQLVPFKGSESVKFYDSGPTVAIVQPNVPQSDKWQSENQSRIVTMLADGTRLALVSQPKLIVWPEAALPDFFFRHKEWLDTLAALAVPSRTPILLGMLDVEFRPPLAPEYFNGAMLVEADGRVKQPVYHKRRLVPVVERVPFIEPRLVRRYSDYFGGYASGGEPVILQTPVGGVGVLVCYESIFPSLAREYRLRGANLLVNVTNDAWFGRTAGPYQHHAHAVLRAVETRTGLVRAANTGISGYIDPLGREQGRTPLLVATTAAYRVGYTDVVSPFVRVGDWVGWSSFGLTLLLLGVGVRRDAAVRQRDHAA